jgi:hypothetical protein
VAAVQKQPEWDSCLGTLGLRIPESAVGREFAEGVRRLIAEADQAARAEAGAPPRSHECPSCGATSALPLEQGDHRRGCSLVEAAHEAEAPESAQAAYLRKVDAIRAEADGDGDGAGPGVAQCKTPACPHKRNTRYDRGPLHGLCEEVCMPAKREEISARSKAARGEPAEPQRYSRGGDPQKWTPDAVTAAIRLWTLERGQPPTTAEWEAPGDERFPSYKSVVRAHGTWEAALASAEPRAFAVVAADVAAALSDRRSADERLRDLRDELVGHPIWGDLAVELVAA